MTDIPLHKVFMAPEAEAAVAKVLRSGHIGQGPVVEKLEAALRQTLQTEHIVTVNSATSGLQLAMHLAKTSPAWREGDEVLSTPLTCLATNAAIHAAGLRLRWCDVDPVTGNIDLADMERKLKQFQIGAVVFVHWGGTPLDRPEDLSSLDNDEGRPVVIADCAHAWGATWYFGGIGMPISSIENWYSVYSLQAIKHVTAGDGGVLVCPDDESYDRARRLRWYGLDRDQDRAGQLVEESGWKYHMNDVAAAIGLANLRYLDDVVSAHRANAQFYKKQLQGVPGLLLTPETLDSEPSYWFFQILAERRDDLAKKLKAAGIACGPVHSRNDCHPCFAYAACPLPGLDALETRRLCIPCGWWLTLNDCERIVKTIKEGW